MPHNGGFAPSVDPYNLKQALNDEDDERYLRAAADSDFARFPGVRRSNPLL